MRLPQIWRVDRMFGGLAKQNIDDVDAIIAAYPGARFSLITFDAEPVLRLPLTTDTLALSSALQVLRPEVTAQRVIFLHQLMGVVDKSLPKLKNRPMASYTLTRYFILYLLSNILRDNAASRPYVSNPGSLTESQMAEFLGKCEEILKTVVVDLNVESKGAEFDYKSILKSPKQGGELAQSILTSYEKDVEREKAETFTGWTPS